MTVSNEARRTERVTFAELNVSSHLIGLFAGKVVLRN